MDRNKRKVHNIEKARISSNLKTLQNRGLLNFAQLDNGEVKVEVNACAVFDLLNSVGDIPFPSHIYIKKSKLRLRIRRNLKIH